MLVVLYRWTIEPEHERAFEQAWSNMTDIVRNRYGGLGSRLHKSENGNYVAYAQWPDKQALDAWRSRAPDADERALSSVMIDGANLIGREELAVLVDMLVPVLQVKAKRRARRPK